MTQRLRGAEQFEEYYTTQFGQRWIKMRAALTEEHLPMLRFAKKNEGLVRALFAQHRLSFTTLPWYAEALLWPTEIPFGATVPGVTEGLLYVMNPSSLIPPLVLSHALATLPAPHILDACAAPGGKTLALADALPGARITANELSVERYKRLCATLHQYGHSEITVLKQQAETLFKKMPQQFDAILLDSPCSSEAHVIASTKHLSEWTPSRVKQMQFRQLALLGGLLLALKPGGILLYSTCSLATQENERVVEKFLTKRGDQCTLLNAHNFFNTIGTTGLPVVDSSISEKLIRILPDLHHLDPMFVALFQKLPL